MSFRVLINNAYQLSAIESCSDAVVMPEPLGNTDIAVTNGIKVVDNLVDSDTEALAMEPSSDLDAGEGIVVQESVDDARVSRDEIGTAMKEFFDGNEVSHEEKEGQYKVKDLVWGKVKSYPWWPGQIFDPSDSTDVATKYSNKKGFLIAYFGDQTFAWNEASKIKPFRKNFFKMVKQSNSKLFCNAVSCALDEVSRRIDFGLACSCLSEEAYGKIKSQVFVNAGIREEASRIDGGDNFSTVATFKAVNIVQSVQDLARDHFDGINRVEVIPVRTQLLAYFRWKGYNQLSAQSLLDGLDNKLEDNSEIFSMEKDKMVEDAKPGSVGKKVSSKKRKLNACDDVSQKHNHVRKDEMILSKKEKSSTKVTPNGRSSVLRRENTSKNSHTKEKNGEKCVEETQEIGQESEVTETDGIKDNEGNAIDKVIPSSPEEQVLSERSSVILDPIPKTSKENSATALILKFTNLDSIPSVPHLNEIFSRYGPVKETETKVLKKNNCAKVVFEAKSNAETAFSSAGKFSIFGPSLISYRLDYSPTPRKTPRSDRKQNKKNGKSAKAIQFDV